ncbi:MAG: PKD domain-containing protein [Thermoplasmata archaeon]
MVGAVQQMAKVYGREFLCPRGPLLLLGSWSFPSGERFPRHQPILSHYLGVAVQAVPTSGSNPLTVYFAATASGGTSPYSFEWAFGDGSTPATTPDTLHTFVAGMYTVYCTVTDANGRLQLDPSGSYGGVSTQNNILDDGSGNMTLAGASLTIAETSTFVHYVHLNGSGLGQYMAWLDSSNSNATALLLSNEPVATAATYTLNCAVFSVTSDSRLKDFSPYGGDPLKELDAVRVGQYRTLGGVDLGSWRAGVAAETLPRSVSAQDPDGWYHVQHPDSFAWLTACVKELRSEVVDLRARLSNDSGK